MPVSAPLFPFTPSLQEKEKDTHIRNSRAVFRTFILEMLTIRCLSTNIKEIIELCTYTEEKSGRFLPAYIHIRNKKSTALI